MEYRAWDVQVFFHNAASVGASSCVGSSCKAAQQLLCASTRGPAACPDQLPCPGAGQPALRHRQSRTDPRRGEPYQGGPSGTPSQHPSPRERHGTACRSVPASRRQKEQRLWPVAEQWRERFGESCRSATARSSGWARWSARRLARLTSVRAGIIAAAMGLPHVPAPCEAGAIEWRHLHSICITCRACPADIRAKPWTGYKGPRCGPQCYAAAQSPSWDWHTCYRQ